LIFNHRNLQSSPFLNINSNILLIVTIPKTFLGMEAQASISESETLIVDGVLDFGLER
jgi:hypothetical protein